MQNVQWHPPEELMPYVEWLRGEKLCNWKERRNQF